MNGLIKKRIQDSGLKKKFLADRLGIASSTLSNFLNGSRALPDGKEKHLREILDKQEQAQ